MLTAATAWDVLAAELYSTASAFGMVIAALTSEWLGPSSAAMAAAAGPYVSWIASTAAQADDAAAQAKAAAAAYEAAFAMTVPPPAIAANRALLLMLVATNFFGQNTPAIMATEAQYMEMWAQDAAAMYGYAGSAAAASTFMPFTIPPETTTSAALTGLFAAVTQAASTLVGTAAQTVSPLTSAVSAPVGSLATTPLTYAAVPGALQGIASSVSLTSSSSTPSLTALASSSAALTSGTSLVSSAGSSASMSTLGVSMLGSAGSLMNSMGPASGGVTGQFQALGSALGTGFGPGAGAFSSPGMGGGAVTAGVGRAASLGVLSVPQGWTSAAPAFNQVASALPGASGLSATPTSVPGASGGPLTAPLAKPQANTVGRVGKSSPLAARYYVRPAMVQQPVYAG